MVSILGRRRLLVSELEANDHEVIFQIEAPPEIEHLFWEHRKLHFRSSVPLPNEKAGLIDACAVALAPVCWVTGATLESNMPISANCRACLDRAGLYLARHYGWKYLDAFGGLLSSADHVSRGDLIGLFYSGGADSTAALVLHRAELSYLVHVSNFDYVDLYLNEVQKMEQKRVGERVTAQTGIPLIKLYSNIANILNHRAFDKYFNGSCTFWYGLQHIQHLAAVAQILPNAIGSMLVAGSFDKLHTRVGSCASSSKFVNLYAGEPAFTLVDENVERQHKIERIADSEISLSSDLRVCFTSGFGRCDSCDKCLGTAAMLLSCGIAPNATGFPEKAFFQLHSKLRQKSVDDLDVLIRHALIGRALSGSLDQRLSQLSTLAEFAAQGF